MVKHKEADSGDEENLTEDEFVCVDLVYTLTVYLRQCLSFPSAPAGGTNTMRNRDRRLAGKRQRHKHTVK